MTDFNAILEVLKTNVTPVSIVLALLLLVSEFLGTNEKVKASSIYGVIKALLATAKDEVFPKKDETPPQQ
jgi:amino acid transporter